MATEICLWQAARLKEESERDMIAQLHEANASVDTLRTAEVS